MSDSKLQSSQVTLAEHLSALMDDEVGSFEQRRVLDELKTDDSLSKKLLHYSLIGESMRASASQAVASSGFLQRIHEQINAEPEYHELHINLDKNKKQSASSTKLLWLRPVGGFAMAASVAAIAVLGFQNYQLNNQFFGQQSEIVAQKIQALPKQQLTMAEMNSATVIPASTLVAANDKSDLAMNTTLNKTKYHSADATMRSFLKPYVDRHMRHASTTAFSPSVRVIAYAGQ